MVDISAADSFLAPAMRSLRSGDTVPFGNQEAGAVWDRIEFHGIAYWLHRAGEQLSDWPEKLRARIAEEARLMGLWEETHRPLIVKLLQHLNEAGIEALLMKGTVLAYTIHDEPSARRRGDSDVLINPSDLAPARDILTQNGWYRARDPHGLYFQEGWLHDAAGFFTHALDLHWETSDRPVLQKALSRANFFSSKRVLARLGDGIYGTDASSTLIHCAINQNWHVAHGYWAEAGNVKGARRLIWSIDFDLLASCMSAQEWQRLLATCDKHGIGPLVARALRGAQADLGTTLPEEAMAQLESGKLNPEISRCLAIEDGISAFWHDLKTANSWADRRHMIASRGLPPREHLVEKYPDKAGWPTALLQGRMMIETAGRVLRRVVAP